MFSSGTTVLVIHVWRGARPKAVPNPIIDTNEVSYANTTNSCTELPLCGVNVEGKVRVI